MRFQPKHSKDPGCPHTHMHICTHAHTDTQSYVRYLWVIVSV